jgi:hypothetical protein
MKPEILLRIASTIMLIHTIGHTFGTFSWKKTTDPIKQNVINQMTSNKFPFMGANRSMGDTVDGSSLCGILALGLITALLWMVSNSLGLQTSLVRNILILLALVLLGQAILEFIYFFPLAGSFTLIACLLIAIAVFKTKWAI